MNAKGQRDFSRTRVPQTGKVTTPPPTTTTTTTPLPPPGHAQFFNGFCFQSKKIMLLKPNITRNEIQRKAKIPMGAWGR